MTWISRNEAAKQLGVEPQTISNYLERGILTGRIINGLTQVSSESIDIFLEKCPHYVQDESHLSNLNYKLCEKRTELMKESLKLDQEFKFLDPNRRRILKVKDILRILLSMSNVDFDEDLIKYIDGESLDSLGESRGLANERMRYYILKASEDAVYDIIHRIESLELEIENLKDENKYLSTVIAQRSAELANKRTSDMLGYSPNEETSDKKTPKMSDRDLEEFIHMRSLLKTSIGEFELSTRIINCLSNRGIKTLGELVSIHACDLYRDRNFGKKSLAEVNDLLESLNLRLGMDISKYALNIEDADLSL